MGRVIEWGELRNGASLVRYHIVYEPDDGIDGGEP